nr:hypothetical protein [uncultured Methanospirillum sp.]
MIKRIRLRKKPGVQPDPDQSENIRNKNPPLELYPTPEREDQERMSNIAGNCTQRVSMALPGSVIQPEE